MRYFHTNQPIWYTVPCTHTVAFHRITFQRSPNFLAHFWPILLHFPKGTPSSSKMCKGGSGQRILCAQPCTPLPPHWGPYNWDSIPCVGQLPFVGIACRLERHARRLGRMRPSLLDAKPHGQLEGCFARLTSSRPTHPLAGRSHPDRPLLVPKRRHALATSFGLHCKDGRLHGRSPEHAAGGECLRGTPPISLVRSPPLPVPDGHGRRTTNTFRLVSGWRPACPCHRPSCPPRPPKQCPPATAHCILTANIQFGH